MDWNDYQRFDIGHNTKWKLEFTDYQGNFRTYQQPINSELLNISKSVLNRKVDLSEYKAIQRVSHRTDNKHFNHFLIVFAVIFVIILFLPWTQNVAGNGFLTTLTPDQRPQTVQSQIPGRIEKWYVREGDFVEKGDTILFISKQ